MKRTIFIFSSLAVAIFVLLRLGQYSVLSGNMNMEIVIAVIAVAFFLIGLYVNKRNNPTSVQRDYEIDNGKIEALDISAREYEVLQLIAEGLSNKEIGERLFISESTTKTHVSNILLKLNAKRRTQAVQIAKSEHIL